MVVAHHHGIQVGLVRLRGSDLAQVTGSSWKDTRRGPVKCSIGRCRMFEEMRDSGLGDPVYRQTSGSVRLTLVAVRRLDPALARRLPTGAEEMLRVLRTASRPLGTGEVMDLVGRSRPWVTRVLGRLRDAGEVTWTGKSARDPRATWTVER